jgi:PAS domain S-box-containing protein
MLSLAEEVADRPANVPQKVAEVALDLCRAQGAGVLAFEKENGGEVGRWRAVAGNVATQIGSSVPRPADLLAARDSAILLARPQDLFESSPAIAEALLMPIFSEGKQVGVICVVTQEESQKFDAEDVRLLRMLAKFASLADRYDRAAGSANGNIEEGLADDQSLDRRLQQQLRTFDTLLSSIADFAYIFDRQGKFSYINRALLDLWGLKLEEAVGKNFFELKYPADLAARLQSQIQQVFETGRSVRDDTPYTSPTGAVGYYDYIFSPVCDDSGNVQAVAGSTRDITERNRVEEALRQSEERSRSLAAGLETQVQARTRELERRTQEVLAQSEQIRELSRRLLQSQDKERRYIARELHDSAGQTLVVLIMQLARLVQTARGEAPQFLSQVREIEEIGQQLNREIRTASYLLHPPLLDETGLRAAVEWYVRGLAERSGMELAFTIAPDFGRCDSEVELVVFRLVQECLTNVHRHSGSKSAEIRLTRDGQNVSLEVQDHGDGMPPERLAQVQSQSAGVGIRGMRERVHHLHGELTIQSDSSGTTIRVVIPAPKMRDTSVA